MSFDHITWVLDPPCFFESPQRIPFHLIGWWSEYFSNDVFFIFIACLLISFNYLTVIVISNALSWDCLFCGLQALENFIRLFACSLFFPPFPLSYNLFRCLCPVREKCWELGSILCCVKFFRLKQCTIYHCTGNFTAICLLQVHPNRPVVILYGDGSCGFSLLEFDTFVRHKLSVIALIGNDACWSQIAREQLTLFNSPVAVYLKVRHLPDQDTILRPLEFSWGVHDTPNYF